MDDLSTVKRTAKSHSNGLARADFLKLVALTGGAAAAGRIVSAGAPEIASASVRSVHQDRAILNYLLTIEYLQAAFYKDAIASGGLEGDLARFAHMAAAHEKAHVHFLRSKLGAHATKPPSFQFGDATSSPRSFAANAVKLEELALGAFVGQGANLTPMAVLHIARIASVEGRHAAWVRDLRKQLPAPSAADSGLGQGKVKDALQAMGFIKGGI